MVRRRAQERATPDRAPRVGRALPRMYAHGRSGQLLRLDRHEVLGFPEANAEAIGIAVLRRFHLGAIEGVPAMAELHRRQARGIHPPKFPAILIHHRIAVIIDPAFRVIEADLFFDALVVPHQLEHVAGKLLAEVLDELSISYLGQVEIGGSLNVQPGELQVSSSVSWVDLRARPDPQDHRR